MWRSRWWRLCLNRWDLIGEDDGGFDLAEGDGPVFTEEEFFFVGGDEVEAVFFVEVDGPGGGRPGADEDGCSGQGGEVGEEEAADAFVAGGGADVGVADEGDVAFELDAHDAGDVGSGDWFGGGVAGGVWGGGVVFGVDVELDAVGDLGVEFGEGHVGFVPAVGGDDAFVGGGGVVDDVVDLGDVGGGGWDDHVVWLWSILNRRQNWGIFCDGKREKVRDGGAQGGLWGTWMGRREGDRGEGL